MAEENKHMDDAFKRMSEELKVKYNPEFWKDAEAKLDDASLDDAFRAAAMSSAAVPDFNGADDIDDMFMDSAFVDAATNQTAAYDASFFEEFMENEGEIVMDEAFSEAAAGTVVDYLPEYWSDVDQVLQKEGLHYEYNSAYWEEARELLDRSDRRIFFTRWSAIAVILLLLSFGGQFISPVGLPVSDMSGMDVGNEVYGEKQIANLHADELKETLLASVNFDRDQQTADIEETDNAVNNNLAELNNQTVLQNENAQNNGDNSMSGLTHETNLNADHSDNRVNDNVHGVNPVDLTGDIMTHVNADMIDAQRRPGNLRKQSNELSSNYINKQPVTNVHQMGYARPIPEIEIIKPGPTTMHSVSLLAHGGIGNKWGEFSLLPTPRSSFGVEYLTSSGRYFQNFEFGTSVMLNHVRQNRLKFEGNATESNVYAKTYRYWRKVQFRDMISFNVNGLVNYRVAPKHKLKFGAGMEYLVAVQSNMSYVVEQSEELVTVNDNWGVKEGIKPFDVRLMMGYEYEISDRFALQLNSNFGMLDRTDNSQKYFNNMQSDVEMNLMLGLKYSFVKRLK